MKIELPKGVTVQIARNIADLHGIVIVRSGGDNISPRRTVTVADDDAGFFAKLLDTAARV